MRYSDIISETRDSSSIEKLARAWDTAMFPRDHPAGKPASDYFWSQHDEYPLDSFTLMTGDEWEQWFDEEVEMWAEEDQPDRYDDMLEGPIHEHIFAVRINGETHIWDGHHRVGASLKAGRKTIPAFIGVPRDQIAV